VWFELAAAVSFPRLLDGAWPSGAEPTLGVRRINLLLGGVATVAAVVVLGTHVARPAAWLEQHRSPAAAATVAAAAGPHGIVLADDEHADWLLWQQPSLEGRVAYDVRFELFDRRQLVQISRLQQASPLAWGRCGVGATVVTFAGDAELRRFAEAGVLSPGARTIARGKHVAAVAQPPAAPCRL
jgi:hypothetical protein